MKAVRLILGTLLCLWIPESEAKDFRFPEVTGWKQSGEIQTFVPKTLFEYINGAADLYLSYSFEELKVAEYLNEKKASVIVDVYRHATPTHAFGIYSQERLPGTDFLSIGVQGYVDKNLLNFLTGTHYVKINSFNTGSEDREILLTFGKKVAENLGEKGSFPSLLATFPAEGKVKNSEKFVSKKFLGYSFFHSAFTADYDVSGKKFKLFVIETGDPKECRNMIRNYLDQTGKIQKDVTEGRYTISDPHHGEVDLYWREATLWGILNLNDRDLRTKYLQLFEKELKKTK